MKCSCCVRIGSICLVCLCLVQGVEAPPENVIAQIVTVQPSSNNTTSTITWVSPGIVNTTDGEVYETVKRDMKLYVNGPTGDRPPWMVSSS
jgi:hypothetical protein